MLGKLFGKREPQSKNPEPGPQLGMLALRSGKGLSPTRICAAWAELFPQIPALEAKPAEKKDGNAVAEFVSDGRTLFLAAMPAPIPVGDIDYAVSRSWMWPDAANCMAEQRAHAIVMTVSNNGPSNPVEEAMAVSRLIAAAAKAGDCVGVYWGNSAQVHSPEMFIDAMQSFEDDLPVMLWVGLAISAHGPSGPFTLSTLGLRPFGHKELEIIESRRDVGDLRMTALNLAGYVLQNGPVLKHGDTFGASETERIKVQHTMSKFRLTKRSFACTHRACTARTAVLNTPPRPRSHAPPGRPRRSPCTCSACPATSATWS